MDTDRATGGGPGPFATRRMHSVFAGVGLPKLGGRARAISRRSSVLALAFPGDRRVWLWSLVAVIPMLGAIGFSVVRARPFYTGTDSVGVRSIVATVGPGQRLCLPGLDVPGGTGAVQLAYGVAGPAPPITVTVLIGGQVAARGAVSAAPPLGTVARVTVPLAPTLPAHPETRFGTVCVTPGHGAPLQVAGFAGLPANAPSPTIDGRRVGGGIALWFLPANAAQRSLIQNWSAIMRRLTLFRPGFAGRVFYWVLFVAGLPLLAYFGLRLLAVAAEPGRRLALGLAAIAFLSAFVWAVTTVAFDSPDESEHFVYTESLAETGRAPDPHPTTRSAYARDEVFALDAVHHFSLITIGDARPPWFTADQHAWQARVARDHPARSDGGGFSITTQVSSPLYYTLLIPGYELGRSGGIFTELFWMRLTSAALGAIVVLAAFATVRELVPSRPELAVAAALLIAFQPMFSFIAGAVNNDNGVNAMAALAVYLTVRILRRGMSWRLGVAVGITAGLLPLMKGTGLALLPAIAIALACSTVGRSSRKTIIGLGAVVASFAAVGLTWAAVAGTFNRSALPVPGGTGLSSGSPGGKLTYLWEVFLPRLPFMSPHWPPGMTPFMFIYVRRGFASFGWYAIFFPQWVYYVVVFVLLLAGAMALAMAVQRRAAVVRRWREVLFLLLVIVGVIAGVELAYYSPTPRPPISTPEQGRYAFTAIVALACVAVGGLLLLPRRWATAVGSILVGAMILFNVASHLLYVAQNFT